MRILPLLMLLSLSLQACSFSYSEGQDGWNDDDWSEWGDNESPDADSGDDVLEDESELADSFWFEPGQLTLGDMQVIELHADPDLCAAVVSIDIFCDVTVHAIETVGDEIRIAVTVEEWAEVGFTHAVVELEDGTSVFLEDAIEVLPLGEVADDECT
ncbi:MAG: hypothetical protein ACJAZO_001420 [Myxococcota bacterium]|jgi:hypothetical protein